MGLHIQSIQTSEGLDPPDGLKDPRVTMVIGGEPDLLDSMVAAVLADPKALSRAFGRISSDRPPRFVLSVTTGVMGERLTTREVIYQGETVRTTIGLGVIAPSGDLVHVHVPFEFQVSLAGQ